MTRVTWTDRDTHAVLTGHVISHKKARFEVSWSNGRVGTFVDGREPPEMRFPGDGDEQGAPCVPAQRGRPS